MICGHGMTQTRGVEHCNPSIFEHENTTVYAYRLKNMCISKSHRDRVWQGYTWEDLKHIFCQVEILG